MEQVATPMESAAASLKEKAKNEAGNMMMKRLRKEMYARLPKFLHPLVPGHRDSFAGAAKKGVSRWFWGLVWSAMFFLVFGGVVAATLLFIVVIVLWAIFVG